MNYVEVVTGIRFVLYFKERCKYKFIYFFFIH